MNVGPRRLGSSSSSTQSNPFHSLPPPRSHHPPPRRLQLSPYNAPHAPLLAQPQVMALLTEMGLEPEFMPYNEGCIELRSEALHAYIARCVHV